MEEWRDIEEFPGYQVSSEGYVRSYWNKVKKKGCWGGYERVLGNEPKELKMSDDGNGYMKVFLQNNDKRRCVKVHRLVAEAFIPRDDDSCDTVDHIISGPEGKIDNSVRNLRWMSRRENIQKAYRDGMCDRRIRRSKQEVLAIDSYSGEEKYYPSIKDSADDLKVHYTTISHAVADENLVHSRYRIEKLDGRTAMDYRYQYYGDDDYECN